MNARRFEPGSCVYLPLALFGQVVTVIGVFAGVAVLLPSIARAQPECADAIPKQIKGTGKYLMSEYTGGGCYEGALENWQKTGFGKHVLGGARAVMVGNWRKNELHGYGEIFSFSYYQRGEFENGKMHGFGVQRMAEWDMSVKKWGMSETYEGEWAKGLRHGFGVLTRVRRDGGGTFIYEGEFRQGFANGQGVLKDFTSVSEGTYIGEVRSTYIENRGHVIMRHGNGAFYGKNGEVVRGEWANDRVTRTKVEPAK